MNKTLVLAACLTLLISGILQARRELRVLVFAEEYRYGKAGFGLAEMLEGNPWHALSVDFSNTASILTAEALSRYDVLVLFNHNNFENSLENNVTRFVRGGGGLVALHHCINHANNNPELTRLIGGYYLLSDSSVHNRNFNLVRIPGVSHPVFEGVPERFRIEDDQDFTIRFYPGQEITRLLTCDIPWFADQNDSGWTRTEGDGRVIYLSPGDPVEKQPFVNNKSLARLITNAVSWAAGQ